MKNKLTQLGIEIKKRFLELQITQKEFCKQHNIPESQLSELMYGTKKLKKRTAMVCKELGIKHIG